MQFDRSAKMNSMFRALALAIAVLSATLARAQDYPTRPVRLIVAFTAGGTADRTARLIAAKMESTLGQAVAVENKPGGNGAVAAQYVAQAEGDGYTLFFTTAGAIAISPVFHQDLNYDPIKDFAAVGKAAINSPVLVVNAAMKANSARELAALARKKPGTITIGITGRGAMSDLALQLFEADAGIQLQSVPYRGAAQAIHRRAWRAARWSGRRYPDGDGTGPRRPAQSASDVLKGAIRRFPECPHFRGTRLCRRHRRQLGRRLGAGRHAGAGHRQIQRGHGCSPQRSRPRNQLREAGTTPAPSSPQQFDAYMREEIARWRAVIRDKGLTGE
jgi:tripartite-type tricarboxylate transporter receptor subunit TctC